MTLLWLSSRTYQLVFQRKMLDFAHVTCVFSHTIKKNTRIEASYSSCSVYQMCRSSITYHSYPRVETIKYSRCAPAWCLYVNDEEMMINSMCLCYTAHLLHCAWQYHTQTLCINPRVYTTVHYLLPNAMLNHTRQRKLHTLAPAYAQTRSGCTRLKAASACLRHCQKVVNRSLADSFLNQLKTNPMLIQSLRQ